MAPALRCCTPPGSSEVGAGLLLDCCTGEVDGVEGSSGCCLQEDRMRELAARARGIGPSTMSTLIPRTAIQIRSIPELLRLITGCRQSPRCAAGSSRARLSE